MLLSLDKLSLRDASSAATEGDRLPNLLRSKAGRIRDRTSDGDTEEEEEEEADEDEDEGEEDKNGGESESAKPAPNPSDEANFWAWRLRPAALCELRHYLAFRLAKAAMPRRSVNTATSAVATTNQCKSEKRNIPISRPLPSLLRRLTCTRGIETEPLTPSTPPSTAPSSPAAAKRPKSLAHRHCLRIRGSQARSLLTGPHPTLGQVFDPARVKPASPKSAEVNSSEPFKPLLTTSQNHHHHHNKTTKPNFPSPPSKNGSLSSETEPESDVPATDTQIRPKLKVAVLPRRPKAPPPPPPTNRERKYGSDTASQPDVTSFPQTPHVRLLELPAHHQPLLHRYGLSQFVLVLDDQSAGSSSSGGGSPCSSSSYRNPLRSVMRKPHVSKGSKKSVTFQEVMTGTSVRSYRDPRYTNVF